MLFAPFTNKEQVPVSLSLLQQPYDEESDTRIFCCVKNTAFRGLEDRRSGDWKIFRAGAAVMGVPILLANQKKLGPADGSIS